MMELLCREKMMDKNFADRDAVIFSDIRVLRHLLQTESLYIPSCNYFENVQSDIQPYMRKVVTTWMLEVCEEQMCEEQVFPLAVNLLDRFLCRMMISRQQLQLLGATTLLIASKIRQCHPLGVDLLCTYTDNSISPDILKGFELLVLSKLMWDTSGVTAFDFVDHIIERTQWCCENPLIRRHAHTLVSICYTEPEFMQTAPSLIASACIFAAIRGLKSPSAGVAPRDICHLTFCDPVALEIVARHIEQIVDKETAALQHYKGSIDSQPETPTDLLAVEF